MTDLDLSQRIDGFETRLSLLEKLMGLNRPPAPPTAYSQPLLQVSQPERQLVQQRLSAPAASDPEPPFELSPENEVPASESLTEPVSEPASNPEPTLVMEYQQPLPMTPITEPGLEQTIGLKWAGWVGAVVLVIGAALGVKYAYDQGWFLAIPPVVRVLLMAVGGFALIAAGEWVYRKVNKVSAAGLFGAGVAVLFVVSYAGSEYYGLYLRNTAFIFMGICTITGALIARRGNMVSIAVLSLIGGNLAPILLRSDHPQLIGFLVYLLMLQGVSLALARWGGATKWWTLRGLSLATTSLWMAAVIDQPEKVALITFAIIYASLFQLELLVTSIESRLVIARAGATFSLLVTAGLTAALLCVQSDYDQMVRLTSMLGMASFAGIGSLICLRKREPSPATRQLNLELGLGYAIQAVALVIVAVPVAFSGVWISAAWGVLAIALVVMGYLLDLRLARYAAPVVWLLAVGDLSMWAASMEISNATRHQLLATIIFHIQFSKTMVMSWLLALLGLVIAKFMSIRRNQPVTENALKLGLALSVCCTGLWVAASLFGLPPLPATASILISAGMLATLDLVDRDLKLLPQAAVVIVLATVKWAVRDTFAPRMLGTAASQSLLFGEQGFTSIVLLISMAMVYHRAATTLETNESSRLIRRVIAVMSVGVIFWMGTFGIDQAFINMRSVPAAMFADPGRAEHVVLSIYWSLFALASIAGGFGWRTAGLRYFGLTLFAVTLLKVVTVDLSQVSTGYRILSFMGLGLLLLGTSVLYGKVSPMLLAKKVEEES